MEKSWKFSRLFCQDQDQDIFCQDQDQDLFVLEAPRDQDFGLEDYITVSNYVPIAVTRFMFLVIFDVSHNGDRTIYFWILM